MTKGRAHRTDYSGRNYLSAVEAARYLRKTVRDVHILVKKDLVRCTVSSSGQMRFRLSDLDEYRRLYGNVQQEKRGMLPRVSDLTVNGTRQRIIAGNSQKMEEISDSSVHLAITSPPYFDAKMYSGRHIEGNLGDIHDSEKWFNEIEEVWRETYRVLQPGRRLFINIMNLPVRLENGSFRALNLTGRTVDLCERIGFIFKRDIVWQKTNSVRAHFGSYPYPGGILINNAHEFILEFEKPSRGSRRKYAHLTPEQKERSKLNREFWISIKKSDVWRMAPEGSGDNRTHVAQFPLDLPARLIRAFSFEGETVLDPFCGSGATLLAAAGLGRNGVGYEVVEEIASEAVNSLMNFKQFHVKE
ncbi:MAG: site-specific DNA-methyltransferase [Thermoplasmata archaeon]|uniref:Type II methyltransferase n=1 Tax=Candidatus Sysuiplasma superficiale TaxID=2823368 RepID=A0A8J7YQ52_9ARCH|nr:site-specific DNA-methyltransferase [Candidatus Sysuiplasma superficiale]MBX8644788.1 site-specific DNA-methyltransferase [Candidatus Sysuiplasma superficiale]MCL5437236.1 site-specific DNA-methyltransferase [Candidatus Thermoplasmatota archaeon]